MISATANSSTSWGKAPPTTPPGTWPTDPPFVNVSGSDLDGIDTNEQYDFTPSGNLEYFKLVDSGTNGGEGPVGSFGR